MYLHAKAALITLAIAIIFSSPVIPPAAAADAPDFEAMDKDVLVYLAKQQAARIEQLEAKIKQLEAQIGAEHGGSAAVVRGDVTLIRDGSWVVTIDRIEQQDVGQYRDEIDRLREQLSGTYSAATGTGYKGINDRIREAEKVVQDIMQRGPYQKAKKRGSVVIDHGNETGYTSQELSRARMALKRVQGEKRGIDLKISELERRIEAGENTVIAYGTTDDGLPVRLEASGVYASAGRQLVENQTFTVTGSAEMTSTNGEITVKTVRR
jgi:hypothetical protein